jgi:transketolase
MRTAFIDTLCELAAADERIWLLTGDLGYSVHERFYERFPGRYLNVGVAEQNMIGIAAGLAHSGKVVFTYSITNFATTRCLEQIRNDVCHHGLPVRVVGVGGGFAYGPQGYTHHGIEDLALMRALPNMTVLAPGDPVETALAMRALTDLPGPCYLRLGKAGEMRVHKDVPAFQLGQAIRVRDGRDVTLISTGGMLHSTVDVADGLGSTGVTARVLSMHTLKPLDAEAVQAAVRETRAIVTVEEHSVIGGLGSAVADAIAAAPGPRIPFYKYGVPDRSYDRVGDQAFMRALAGDLTTIVTDLIERAAVR